MRYAIVSDSHRATAGLDAHDLFPNALAVMRREDGQATHEALRLEMDRAFHAGLRHIHTTGQKYRIDGVITLGDMVNGWRERGIIEPKTQRLAQETAQELHRLGLGTNLHLAGNHELGYSKHSTLPNARLNMAAVEAWCCHFGDLWWAHLGNETLFLGLCSPIAEYSGGDHDIKALAERQRRFLRARLEDLRSNGVIVFMHSPFALPQLPELNQHVDRVKHVIVGEFHDPRIGKWICRIQAKREKNPWAAYLWKKVVVCGSTAPIWWPGYAMLDLAVNPDGESALWPVVKLERPKESIEAPTSSLARCLLWRYAPGLVHSGF